MEEKEILTETIRQQMSRGNYRMDQGELPYSGPAACLSEELWNQGWRRAPSDRMHSLISAENSLAQSWASAFLLVMELEDAHDRAKAEMTRADDYQRGYLHAMDVAILIAKGNQDQIGRDMEFCQKEIERERRKND